MMVAFNNYCRERTDESQAAWSVFVCLPHSRTTTTALSAVDRSHRWELLNSMGRTWAMYKNEASQPQEAPEVELDRTIDLIFANLTSTGFRYLKVRPFFGRVFLTTFGLAFLIMY